MELHNRKLLLLNEDLPINSEPPPPPPSSSMFSPTFQLPPPPIFTSNLAYVFLILLTTVFFLGFVLLYIRHLSSDSDSDSFRGRICRRNSSSGDASAADNPLPELPYRGDSKPQQVECAICLDEFCEGETVKTIPYCKHVFHPECINTWLVAHVTCPVCRCEKTCCEVGRAECGRVEERGGEEEEEEEEEEGREAGFQSEGEAVAERRTRGSSSGSRIGLRRSLSF